MGWGSRQVHHQARLSYCVECKVARVRVHDMATARCGGFSDLSTPFFITNGRL